MNMTVILDDNEHLTFVEAVLARPAMYTMNGSFEEVVAFLNGYTNAFGRAYCLGVHNASIGKVDDSLKNAPFSEWSEAIESLGVEMSCSRTEVFLRFRSQFQDSENAIKALFDRVKLFVEPSKY